MDYICTFLVYLLYRNASKALSSRIKKRRSHVAVWKWVQKYKPERIFTKRKRIFEFIIEMRHKLKLAIITFGYGLQLNHHQKEQFLAFVFLLLKEICLLQNSFLVP
jgi:hypothetical protein